MTVIQIKRCKKNDNKINILQAGSTVINKK